jgi:uncharacterized protein YlzI (FlbEa/FlbD family)
MDNFHKIVSLGKIPYETDKATNLLELEITFQNGKLSFSGDVWNNNFSDIVTGGQCINVFRKHKPEYEELYTLWERWHLNDLNAGTPPQEEFLRNYKNSHPEWKHDYDNACLVLKENNLYEVNLAEYGQNNPDFLKINPKIREAIEKSETPIMYQYGRSWLKESVPEPVIQKIKEYIKKIEQLNCPVSPSTKNKF